MSLTCETFRSTLVPLSTQTAGQTGKRPSTAHTNNHPVNQQHQQHAPLTKAQVGTQRPYCIFELYIYKICI